MPVYMSGMYSIKAGTNAFAYEVIRSVLLEEMLHMTLAANLLNAVGREPDTKKFVRKYPAKLPFSDASLPKIHLRHYSPEALETFKLIERPRSFVPPTPNAKGWTSISPVLRQSDIPSTTTVPWWGDRELRFEYT
jgi:hypothetical protein